MQKLNLNSFSRAVLSIWFAALLGMISSVDAGPNDGLTIPEQIKEFPSELGFIRYRGNEPDQPRLTTEVDRAGVQGSRTVPRFTHNDYPGLIFEGLGDLGSRLAALNQPLGKPRIINLLGPNAQGTQRLENTVDSSVKISTLENINGSVFPETTLSPDENPFPIIIAHLHIDTNGAPSLGTPDGSKLVPWERIQRELFDQGSNPIVLACNSSCLSEANFSVSTPIDVNEIEIVLARIHESKTLGELLSAVARVSPQGLTVRTVKYTSGLGERSKMLVEGYVPVVGAAAGTVIGAAVLLPSTNKIYTDIVYEGALTEGDGLLSDRDAGNDSSYYDEYRFDGLAGQTIHIKLTSDAFDAYLHLLGSDKTRIADNDQVSGDSDDAEINCRLNTNGAYTVLANSYGPGEIGEYELVIEISNPNALDTKLPFCDNQNR